MNYFQVLAGFGIGILIVAIALYVVCSLAYMKALNALGYDKAWLAWIPYGVYYACAASVTKDEEKVKMFGSFEVPAMVFKLWWLVPIVLLFLPLNSTFELVLNLIVQIVFLGCTFAKMYAALDGKQESETQVLGCVSGFIPFIAVVKFLIMKK